METTAVTSKPSKPYMSSIEGEILVKCSLGGSLLLMAHGGISATNDIGRRRMF